MASSNKKSFCVGSKKISLSYSNSFSLKPHDILMFLQGKILINEWVIAKKWVVSTQNFRIDVYLERSFAEKIKDPFFFDIPGEIVGNGNFARGRFENATNTTQTIDSCYEGSCSFNATALIRKKILAKHAKICGASSRQQWTGVVNNIESNHLSIASKKVNTMSSGEYSRQLSWVQYHLSRLLQCKEYKEFTFKKGSEVIFYDDILVSDELVSKNTPDIIEKLAFYYDITPLETKMSSENLVKNII